MRWMWIDQIVESEPKRLVAVKNVSLAEEHLHDHFPPAGDLPAQPIHPASLIIEGMAQTAGILVGAARQFREKVILAKVVRVELDADAGPGETLRYEATIDRMDEMGAATNGVIGRRRADETGWTEIGRIDLLFSHVDRSMTGVDVPEHNFVFGDNLKVILEGAGLSLPAGLHQGQK